MLSAFNQQAWKQCDHHLHHPQSQHHDAQLHMNPVDASSCQGNICSKSNLPKAPGGRKSH
jgi:hypothetical protein